MLPEILLGLCFIWVVGILFFAWGIADLFKNDPTVTEAFNLNAEMNPVGLIILSMAVVFWPAMLLLKLLEKR